MEKVPLLNNKISILLWILLLAFLFIPKEKISEIVYYSLSVVVVFILMILFLDAYNPKEENRNSVLWKLRVYLWGDPNIKNK
jgi:hypothetical protein